ncbi:MAG: hypothetical protein HY617_04060 [Candidatus Sungbacteria bacterium]|nr:hypothetical protein [Candidatus Sungbacteria bacterium]
MIFFTSFFHRASPDAKQNLLARAFRILRGRSVVIGTYALAMLAVGVLLFDGLVFYTDVVKVRQPVAGSEKKINLSEKEITETLGLLDARQKKFDDILSVYEEPGSAASSTKAR